jgi:ferredoxin
MIITQKKPLDEVWQMLEGVTRVALVGCGSCATSCKTGGEPELQEMKEYLEANGKVVTATIIPSESCQKLLMKKELKALKDTDTQAILTLACGDGVQTVADNANIPVYPATNTMFLGQVERVGLFSEACRMCGDCVLGHTGGICPITKCAKSLVNGPCGGQRNGKCEVNPENNCAWIDIYYRLDALGQLDKLKTMRTDKNYKNFAFPRRISIREEK